MDILKSLNFVKGAVGKKDFIPLMTHFVIEDGYIISYNGELALKAPISIDLNCKPKALPFFKAISACSDVINFSMSQNKKLNVSSTKFKALIPCLDMESFKFEVEGEKIDIDGNKVLECFEKLYPFIADDASRPWSNGVLLADGCAFATNNVCLIQYWLGINFPIKVNIPRNAIGELLRLKEPPRQIQINENFVTFYFDGERMLKTHLYATEWPDISRILDVESNPVTLPEDFFEGVEILKPFTDNLKRIFVKSGAMTTHENEEEGAKYQLDIEANGVFQIEMLSLLKSVTSEIDLSAYPKPCIFYGENLRGAIVGLRSF